MFDEKLGFDPAYVRSKVQDAMGWHFDNYSFEDLVDDTEKLSDKEKEWAKSNLDWQVTFLDNSTPVLDG